VTCHGECGKKNCWSHTPMCFNLPLKAMMVTMLGWCGTKGIWMSFTKFWPLSLDMHVGNENGHCKVIYANIKLLFS
jgi:hypothetical protein